MTARTSVSAGSAPRSRSASSWPFDVVGRGAHEQAQEGEPPRLREAADDAEVEERGAAVGQDEEVPAVEVAVEDAVDHGALHEPDHPGPHDLLGVDAGALHARDVVELEALEALHHEHPPGHERRVGTGDHVVALTEVGVGPGHVEHVLGLEAEVELLGDRLGEELHQRGRVGQGRHRDAPDEERCDPCHDPQVAVHELADRGPLHLDDDVLAGEQRRPVDLCDRRRGEGLRAEVRGTPPPAGLPRSSSTTARTAEKGSGGTWSRQRLNSATSSGGKMPSPDDRICPSLMYVGPRRSAASRTRRERSAIDSPPPSAASADGPHADGAAEQRGGAHDAHARRHLARAHEAREVRGDLSPQRRDGVSPPHRIGLDDPRRVRREAPEDEVGRRFHLRRAHCSWSLAPAAGGIRIGAQVRCRGWGPGR